MWKFISAAAAIWYHSKISGILVDWSLDPEFRRSTHEFSSQEGEWKLQSFLVASFSRYNLSYNFFLISFKRKKLTSLLFSYIAISVKHLSIVYWTWTFQSLSKLERSRSFQSLFIQTNNTDLKERNSIGARKKEWYLNLYSVSCRWIQIQMLPQQSCN